MKPALAGLVEAGELVPSTSRAGGDRRTCTATPGSRAGCTPAALLSPFDPLVWERERTERLFDFHYRIEIYVPEPKRVHGYYVLPFLLGDRLVARVDLKADRQAGAPAVKGAFAEPHAPQETAEELAEELRGSPAGWAWTTWPCEPRGDLASRLAAAAILGLSARSRTDARPAGYHGSGTGPDPADRRVRPAHPDHDNRSSRSCLPSSTRSFASARARSSVSWRRSRGPSTPSRTTSSR